MIKKINNETLVYKDNYYDTVCTFCVFNCDIEIIYASKRKFFNLIKTNSISAFEIEKIYKTKLLIELSMFNEISKEMHLSLQENKYIYFAEINNSIYVNEQLFEYIESYKIVNILVR